MMFVAGGRVLSPRYLAGNLEERLVSAPLIARSPAAALPRAATQFGMRESAV